MSTIISNNQIFDGPRFGAYFKSYLGLNSRRLGLYALMVLICSTVLTLFPLLIGDIGSPRTDGNDPMWGDVMISNVFLFLVVMAMAGTQMYSAFNSKAHRISVLTTPASNFEKFLTWFIIYFAGMLVCFYVSMIIADVLRVLLAKGLYGMTWARVRPLGFVITWKEGIDQEAYIGWIINLGAMLAFNVFALGAMVWKNAPFVKTFAFMFGFIVLCIVILFNAFRFWFADTGIADRFNLDNFVTEIVVATGLALNAFFCWLAYKRMTESESVVKW